MAKIEAFEKYYLEYEQWFENNANLYKEEIKTLKSLIKPTFITPLNLN